MKCTDLGVRVTFIRAYSMQGCRSVNPPYGFVWIFDCCIGAISLKARRGLASRVIGEESKPASVQRQKSQPRSATVPPRCRSLLPVWNGGVTSTGV